MRHEPISVLSPTGWSQFSYFAVEYPGTNTESEIRHFATPSAARNAAAAFETRLRREGYTLEGPDRIEQVKEPAELPSPFSLTSGEREQIIEELSRMSGNLKDMVDAIGARATTAQEKVDLMLAANKRREERFAANSRATPEPVRKPLRMLPKKQETQQQAYDSEIVKPRKRKVDLE